MSTCHLCSALLRGDVLCRSSLFCRRYCDPECNNSLCIGSSPTSTALLHVSSSATSFILSWEEFSFLGDPPFRPQASTPCCCSATYSLLALPCAISPVRYLPRRPILDRSSSFRTSKALNNLRPLAIPKTQPALASFNGEFKLPQQPASFFVLAWSFYRAQLLGSL